MACYIGVNRMKSIEEIKQRIEVLERRMNTLKHARDQAVRVRLSALDTGHLFFLERELAAHESALTALEWVAQVEETSHSGKQEEGKHWYRHRGFLP